MRILILDTETTTLDYPRVVQLAYKDVETGKIVNELFKPPTPISYGSMAIHHITNEMVANKPAFSGSQYYLELATAINDDAIIVAHNAPFDIQVLKNEGIIVKTFIDTCRVARHVVKSEHYSLQYLRYSLHLPITNATAHDALGDILVLERLFYYLKPIIKENFSLQSDEEIVHKMMQLSSQPLLLKTITFGKYNGKTYEEVSRLDKNYLQWLHNSETQKNSAEQREELVYTLKFYLTKETPQETNTEEIVISDLPF